MKSLLNKSLSQFMICTVAILILTIPLFYFLTKSYYAEEMRDVIHVMSLGKPLPPLDLEEDIMVGMTMQYILIFLILSLSLLLVMRFLTRRLWKPFDDTLAKIEHFNLEKSQIPAFAQSDIKEFERLNSCVTDLMKKDKNTYNSQKEFTENASHELQTPIAVIKSKLDLLMQESLNQNQARLVAEMYSICSRMSRLNKNLLMLAKIENRQYEQTEEVNLEELVLRRIPTYEGLNNGGKISLECEGNNTLKANTPLLESAVDNLVINAIRHKPDNEDITIKIGKRTLAVINKGNSDTPLDKSKLFRRFSNNGDKTRGNGLGLSIVKAICDYHHWQADYQYVNGCHHFIIDF